MIKIKLGHSILHLFISVSQCNCHSRIFYYIEEFIGNSLAARRPGRGCKTRPHHQPSTTICDSWYEAFLLMCV